MSRASITFIALAAAALLLLMPVAGTVHAAGSLTVSLDKQSYKAGDTVTITGKAPTSDPIVIQVYNPNGDPYRVDQIKPEANGSYLYKLKVGGPLGVNGEFKVKVAYLNSSVDAKFTLTGGKEPAKKPVASLFKVTVESSKKDSKAVIRSDKKAKPANKVVLDLDKDLGKAKVRAPSGWKVDIKGKTVTFTATTPLKAGKSVRFILPAVIKSAGWTMFDGSAQLEKGTATAGKK